MRAMDKRGTFSSGPVSRRAVLRSIGGGFGMLGLANVLATPPSPPYQGGAKGGVGAVAAAEPASSSANPLAPKPPHFQPRAKRVIFLFMNGAPSHVDTFDPKPALAKYDGQDPPDWASKGKRRRKGGLMKSPFRTRRYGQCGVEASELFPHVGAHMDNLCVMRTMYTDNPNHEPGLLMMNSGNMQPIRPSLGSWLAYGLGTENQNLPGFVVLCPGKPVVGPQLWSNSFLPGIYQGTHINNKKIDPKKIIDHLENRYLSQTQQRRQLDLLQEMNRVHLERRGRDDQLEARIASLEIAFRMQHEAQDAFDISHESTATRQRYGDGEFANACLIARRLAERGVRMVQVYYGNNQPWDAHGDIMDHRRDALKSDQPIAALLADLKGRGLLEETLVLWGGEFGRTPTAERSKGRDHHAATFSMWLAGGGVKGGMVYGVSDELGFRPAENPVHVHDLHATILHLMGLDHERLTYRYSGRDFRLTDVHGQVVREIIA